MAFIGNTNTTQAFTPAVDYFSGNGSTTAFTLSRPVASVAQVQAVVNNVAQNPSSAFTVSGNTITFTSAPLSGTNNIYVYYTSPITQVIAPGQGTVGTTQLQNGLTVNFADGTAAAPSITNDGDTNTGVFYPAADTVGVSTGGSERMRIDSSGNINIATAGARITGDFSNATVANRVMFQTSTSNSNTTVRAIPSGSGANAGWIADNNSDVTNSSFAQFGIVGTTDVRIQSSINGTGTYLPMTFYTGGSERMRIDSSGNLQFNSGYGSVATAYGCRAWVNFNGTGTVAIRASGNVSSITDNGTGDYTVNFTNAMPDANYAPVFGGTFNASGTSRDNNIGVRNNVAPTTTALRINVFEPNTGLIDALYCNVAIFR